MTDTTVKNAPTGLDLSGNTISADGGKTSQTLAEVASNIKALQENSGSGGDVDISTLVTKKEAFQDNGYLQLSVNGDFVGSLPDSSGNVNEYRGYTTDGKIAPAVDKNVIQILQKNAVTRGNITQSCNTIIWNTMSGAFANMAFAGSVFHPETTGGSNLGASGNLWNNIFSKNAVTVSSDKNLKTEVALDISISDALYEKLEARTYTLNDSIAEKGDNARIHTGFFAQDVESILKDANIDPSKIAMWISNPNETVSFVKSSNGEMQPQTTKIIDIDGVENVQALRYEEILVAIFQGAKNKITSLEKRLAALEEKAGE